LTNQPLTFIRKADDTGRGSSTFFVRHDLNRAALKDGDAAVRRAQIYADRFSHIELTVELLNGVIS
jgi:hypothetical protein